MSRLGSFLLAFVTILVASAALYQSQVTERVVSTSLEAIRGEIRGLRRSAGPPLPSSGPAPAAAAAPQELEASPARDREALQSAVAIEPSSAPGYTQRDAERGTREQAKRQPGEAESEVPRLSRGEIERVRERRKRRDVERQLRRFDRLASSQAETRAQAVFGLDPEDRRDAEALLIALDDPDPRVRVEAASRLQFGEPHVALPLLVQALADPEAEVVVEAIDSLKFVGDPAAISDLERLLDHPDPSVQREAGDAVARLSQQRG